MANTLGFVLEGKYIVLKQKDYPKAPEIIDRVFLCQSGFGCKPSTSGTAIYGRFIADNERCRVSGYEVERLATPEEIKRAYQKRVKYLAIERPATSEEKSSTCARCGIGYRSEDVIVLFIDGSYQIVCPNCQMPEIEEESITSPEPKYCTMVHSGIALDFLIEQVTKDPSVMNIAGKSATIKDKDRLLSQLYGYKAKGFVVFPMCDNVDEKGICKGHPPKKE